MNYFVHGFESHPPNFFIFLTLGGSSVAEQKWLLKNQSNKKVVKNSLVVERFKTVDCHFIEARQRASAGSNPAKTSGGTKVRSAVQFF